MISPLSLARHRQMHTEKTGERLTDTEAMSAVRFVVQSPDPLYVSVVTNRLG